jgi:hypothetical protein
MNSTFMWSEKKKFNELLKCYKVNILVKWDQHFLGTKCENERQKPKSLQRGFYAV